MNYLDCKGASVAFETIGDGQPLVFAHCSSASHKAWLFAARKLAPDYRSYLPDLMGYGQTSWPFDELGRAIPCTDLDVIDAMVNEAGEPVDIVAHSYGAATCLEYAAMHPDKVGRLILFEPPSFHYLQNDGFGNELQEVQILARNVMEANACGNNRAAAQHFMSFWLGRLRWLLAPRRFKRRVVATMDKVAQEFSLLREMSPRIERLLPLAERLTLVAGARSTRPAIATSRLIANSLPGGHLIQLPRAGHMMPFTHREDVLDIVISAMSRTRA